MPDNKTTENILATVGAVLWAIQGIPQVVKSYRTQSTKGLSPYLMLLWMASGLFFCTYVVTRDLAIPAVIQPHASLIIYTISWGQCLYYSCGYSLIKTILCAGGALLAGAAFEGASIAGLLAGKRHGTEIPMVVYGYASTVIAVIGILPQYYEIYKQKEVIGLSITFVITDLVGAVCLIAALFLRERVDIAGLATYALTFAMVLGIVILALILNPLAARRRRLAGLPSKDLESAVAASGADAKDDLEKVISATPTPELEKGHFDFVSPKPVSKAEQSSEFDSGYTSDYKENTEEVLGKENVHSSSAGTNSDDSHDEIDPLYHNHYEDHSNVAQPDLTISRL
ncbi:hypothetical protein I316_03000 [Kwoniella heveanensis BCC8398]|uniref:Uncharacterized protein n=1 Tax=Kwoniella heveanensis BCC8398 TaxID=1296120 RepID=A0A1B9GWN5_9TREE|nr:hypothetical protein I316_03000 [Kwoniella heveanensis BCC8398]